MTEERCRHRRYDQKVKVKRGWVIRWKTCDNCLAVFDQSRERWTPDDTRRK